MNKKAAIIIAILGIFGIIQASIAPHFLFLGGTWLGWLNLVDAAVAAVALFEKRGNRLGWWAAAWGGVLLDLYSGRFFGFWIIILLGIVAFIKLIIKKYVRIPSYW